MRSRVRVAILLCASLAAAGILIHPAMAAVTPAPAWQPLAAAGPTNLAPGAEGTIAVYVQNVGGKTSEGAITLVDELPAGIVTTATPFDPSHTSHWVCSAGAGQSTVTCTTTDEVGPGTLPNAIDIPVKVSPDAETGQNVVTFSGGGAAKTATYEGSITISTEPAKAGVVAYYGATYDADGKPSPQAGSHPYATNLGFMVNTVLTPNGKAVVPAGDPKTVAVDIPPGFLGNPTATPQCAEGLLDSQCPIDTQVGLAFPAAINFGGSPVPSAVHSTEAPVGYPAKFTFGVVGDLYQANLLASLRSDEDYGITVTAPNLAQIVPLYGGFSSIWGDPASPEHDGQRCIIVPAGSNHGAGCGPSTAERRAFITMASDCAFQAENPPFVKAAFDSWQAPGVFDHEAFAIPAVTGCNLLSMGGEFGFEPETHEAATPSAYEAEMTLPQEGLIEPDALATPPPKRVEVAFPAGVNLNASAADGLETCSLKQIGYKGNEFEAPNHIRFNKEPNHCPDASKVGTVEVQTELLAKPLNGAIYLAAQGENPFNSLLGVYLVIEDSSIGIIIKLPGEMVPDPQTGQIRTVFDDLPQAAVGKVLVKIKGGDRSPLATPDTCGTFYTEGTITPWSAPESGAPLLTKSSFQIYTGPKGAPCANTPQERPFDLDLSAGASSTQAGAYSPFSLRLTRPDGNQEIESLQINTPPGFTASLKGLTQCSDTQIAAAEHQANGKAEQASPTCPASSQVGTTLVGAGVGSTPIYTPGKLYLAGPYKGAPLSVVAITPAVAGPFDLGDVVIRNALYLDPTTAQITAKSDPIPRLLRGIPTNIRDVRIDLDRKDWAINPTSCEASRVKLSAHGSSGATEDLSTRFQVGGCESLAFKPKLSAKLKGGTKRGAFPAFSTTTTWPEGRGFANTKYIQVTLPRSEFLEQGHIRTVCTRVQFAAKECPAGSIYGQVEAFTPLLDQPLSGNVYLRSNPEQVLPDVVLDLHGPPSMPIEVTAAGHVDSVKRGGIRTTFEGIPDAPVSKVTVTLQGAKKGLLVNSANLCTHSSRMTVRMIGQNNARGDQFPLLGNSCKKARKHKKRRRGR